MCYLLFESRKVSVNCYAAHVVDKRKMLSDICCCPVFKETIQDSLIPSCKQIPFYAKLVCLLMLQITFRYSSEHLGIKIIMLSLLYHLFHHNITCIIFETLPKYGACSAPYFSSSKYAITCSELSTRSQLEPLILFTEKSQMLDTNVFILWVLECIPLISILEVISDSASCIQPLPVRN